MNNIVTISDKNYVIYGIKLFLSLSENCKDDFTLHFLCLDDETYNILKHLDDRIICYNIKNIFIDNNYFNKIKYSQDRRVFCCSLSSLFSNYIMNLYDISIMYIDSDVCFYNDIKIIYDEIGDSNIGIIKHRHINNIHSIAGIYNVGIVFFKNSKEGRSCLEFWTNCVFDEKNIYKKTHGTCIDQKYLELFDKLYSGVCVIDKNVGHGAPWNFKLCEYIPDRGGIIYNNIFQPLVFIHYCNINRIFNKSNDDIDIRSFNEYNLTWGSEFLKKYIYDLYHIKNNLLKNI